MINRGGPSFSFRAVTPVDAVGNDFVRVARDVLETRIGDGSNVHQSEHTAFANFLIVSGEERR